MNEYNSFRLNFIEDYLGLLKVSVKPIETI